MQAILLCRYWIKKETLPGLWPIWSTSSPIAASPQVTAQHIWNSSNFLVGCRLTTISTIFQALLALLPHQMHTACTTIPQLVCSPFFSWFPLNNIAFQGNPWYAAYCHLQWCSSFQYLLHCGHWQCCEHILWMGCFSGVSKLTNKILFHK